jgi:membrane-associated phospholipid phosphatase
MRIPFKQRIANALIPLGLGYALFLARPWIYQPWCSITPDRCTQSSVNRFDQLAFQWGSIQADFWSNVLQNSVGVLYFGLPLALAAFRLRSWNHSLHQLVIFIQVMLWNFFGLEGVRAIAQRPRPLVFAAPLSEGLNIHHYTSFYSGHTSFVALATTGIALYLAPKKWPWALYLVATFTTGALRVVGGRHYPTDVLAGAILGTLIAWAHRNQTLKNIHNNP